MTGEEKQEDGNPTPQAGSPGSHRLKACNRSDQGTFLYWLLIRAENGRR